MPVFFYSYYEQRLLSFAGLTLPLAKGMSPIKKRAFHGD